MNTLSNISVIIGLLTFLLGYQYCGLVEKDKHLLNHGFINRVCFAASMEPGTIRNYRIQTSRYGFGAIELLDKKTGSVKAWISELDNHFYEIGRPNESNLIVSEDKANRITERIVFPRKSSRMKNIQALKANVYRITNGKTDQIFCEIRNRCIFN